MSEISDARLAEIEARNRREPKPPCKECGGELTICESDYGVVRWSCPHHALQYTEEWKDINQDELDLCAALRESRRLLAVEQAGAAALRIVVLSADDEAVSEDWMERARTALSTDAGARLLALLDAQEKLISLLRATRCGSARMQIVADEAIVAAEAAVEAARKAAGRNA